MSPTRRPPAPRRARLHALIAALLSTVLGLGILVATEPAVGITRDEGIYMVASRRYGRWLRDVSRGRTSVFDGDARDEAFRRNREHPDLMKIASGVSELALAPGRAEATSGPPDGSWAWRSSSAHRLPAMLLAALGSGLLAVVVASLTTPIMGAAAGLGLLAMPRWFFHAHLHCFDVPIAVWIFAVVVCWHRARTSRAAVVGVGVLMGLAIGTKHNALFVVPLLALDELACLWLRWRATGVRPRPSALVSWRLASVCVLGPLIALATWPWLWSAPIDRLAEYLAFHREHAYYNMELLGTNYNEPPMPIAYPFVMTAATVPWSLLAAAALGACLMVRDDLRGDTSSEEGQGRPPTLGLTTAVFTGFPILLIALPFVPIFGGTKHWLTAYPFLTMLAAVGLHRCISRATLTGRARTLVAAAAPLLLFAPAAASAVSGHPYGLSQYGGMIGGARGGATLGLNRGFWGYAVPPLLDPTIDLSSIDGHDVHPLSTRQYQLEGRWPERWRRTRLDRADGALHFYERHTVTHEVEVWNRMGTTRPARLVTVEDVPVSALYLRHRP